MDRNFLVVALSLFGVLAFLPFNNCGEVGFQNATDSVEQASASAADPSVDSSAAGAGSGDPSSPGPAVDSAGTDLTAEQIGLVLGSLPDQELEFPRPITDLDSDPTLYELYKCPGSDGVVICHFPESVADQHTKCVGRPAVSTHYDHIRTYAQDGQSFTVSDYLGPCRF